MKRRQCLSLAVVAIAGCAGADDNQPAELDARADTRVRSETDEYHLLYPSAYVTVYVLEWGNTQTIALSDEHSGDLHAGDSDTALAIVDWDETLTIQDQDATTLLEGTVVFDSDVDPEPDADSEMYRVPSDSDYSTHFELSD